MPQSEYVFEVSEGEFEKAVLARSRTVPVVVDFWAPWCGPCRSLAPILERLIGERNGDVLLAKVNIDEAQELAARMGVQSIPHVMAFRDARPILDFVGLLPESQIREFLERILPTEADRLAEQATTQVESDPAAAEQLFRQALEKDRHHQASLLGLARVLFAQGKIAEAKEPLEELGPGSTNAADVERLNGLIALQELAQTVPDETSVRQRLDATPDDAENLFALGVHLAVQGKYPESLERLLMAGQRNPRLASTRVREAMVNVFKTIGIRDPLADEYRQKLSMLLY